MQEQIKQIAMRIQVLRDILGISAEQMAEHLSMTVEQYARYEAGGEDFSFSLLYKIANFLGVDFTDLLTGDSPKLHMCCFIKKGEGLAIDRRKAYRYQHLAPTFRNKKAEPFQVRVPYEPDKAGCPERNSHEGQEFDFMLSGKMRILVGESEFIMEAGDCLYYDSGYPHAMEALDGDAEFLAIIMK